MLLKRDNNMMSFVFHTTWYKLFAEKLYYSIQIQSYLAKLSKTVVICIPNGLDIFTCCLDAYARIESTILNIYKRSIGYKSITFYNHSRTNTAYKLVIILWP